ncbi:ParB/RepB/Spo0J family partition protein [Planctomycetes bacterium K23_9]|uniref:Chromosome-partitioning protein ParB n=1 Tax=Stieleria marina TaxID=1930275 RepID=A0A517P295_9BACT|nr:Chromosome-partitioning protein ParB [Planctomycetes bacterium K23_9]
MGSTRNALEEVKLNVNESMGLRPAERRTQLAPVSSAKDVGRVPLRTFGKIDVNRVIPDPDQPRTEFDEQEIAKLAASIRSHGQLHPIRVRWHESNEKWIVISGERRWRATKAAGLPNVNCFFVEGEISEPEIREQQLVENLYRRDLNSMEEARAYQSLMTLNEWNGKQVAESLHLSTSRVSRALALLDLPEELQSQVESGTLSKSSAYELSKLDNDRSISELAAKAASGELPHAKAVRQVKIRRGKKVSKARSGIHLVFAAENGAKVTVTATTKMNYHEVELGLNQALDDVRHRIRNNIKLF